MGTRVNHPNSQNDALTTVSHMMASFEHAVKIELQEVTTIYDDELSYETGLRKAIAKNNFSGDSKDLLPLFVYNRTPLKDSELAAGKRFKSMRSKMRVGDSLLSYAQTYAECDIQFLYVTPSIEKQEKFESTYLSDEGISGTKELIVNMNELGDFKYFLRYDELNEIQIQNGDMYYKGIVGSINVRGFYFTFRGESGIIKSIEANFWDSLVIPEQTELLGTCQINGDE